jgi:PAS domain S-box-containing protein
MNADFEMLVAAQALDAAIVQTAEGEVLYWNPGAEAIFGYARAEALGRSIEDLTVPDNRREEERRWDPRDSSSRTNHIRIASATEGRVARLC